MTRTLLLLSVVVLAACSDKKEPEQVSLSVTSSEALEPGDSLHVVGTFNNWQFDTPLVLVDGKFTALLPKSDKPFIFNFVKNTNWQSQPASVTGKSQCPLLYLPSYGDKYQVTIENWLDSPAKREPSATIAGTVEVLSNFNMPQLNRAGDVSVYLPPSYKSDESKTYPVLYMFDGQNVFNEQTSYSDEWQVDEILERMSKDEGLQEIIVVAIANGPRRWNEYTPWDHKNWSGEVETGEGNKTFSFITDTLKPFIDDNYRSKKDRDATGIAGSSLGGLMSIYAAMEHSDTFGFVAAFSPSLGVTNPEGEPLLLTALNNKKALQDTRIYLDMGELEYGSYKEVDQLHQVLMDKSTAPELIKLVKDDLGRHCELDWRRRFPGAVAWLLAAQD